MQSPPPEGRTGQHFPVPPAPQPKSARPSLGWGPGYFVLAALVLSAVGPKLLELYQHRQRYGRWP